MKTTLLESVAAGTHLTIADAARRSQIPYWKLWRRLRRDGVPTSRLHGRRYVSVDDLSRPSLRIP
jgi:hypothetical protein